MQPRAFLFGVCLMAGCRSVGMPLPGDSSHERQPNAAVARAQDDGRWLDSLVAIWKANAVTATHESVATARAPLAGAHAPTDNGPHASDLGGGRAYVSSAGVVSAQTRARSTPLETNPLPLLVLLTIGAVAVAGLILAIAPGRRRAPLADALPMVSGPPAGHPGPHRNPDGGAG